MEEIAILAEKAVTFIVCFALYLYFMTSVLPRVTLRLRLKPADIRDRGIRRVVFPTTADGTPSGEAASTERGVVYAPEPAARRFMPAYALFTRDGHVYIRCRLHPRVAYIRYDVAVFDVKGRLLDLLRVDERVTACGESRPVRLPAATAYASVTVRIVDSMYENRRINAAYSPLSLGIFGGIAVLTTVAMSLLIHDSLSNILAMAFPRAALPSVAVMLLVGVLLGAVCAAWILLRYYLRRIRARKP